jgi:diadenosine tetraphosphate (Ap4A) HIT family hydrolase
MADCMMCQIVSGDLDVDKIVETAKTIGYVAHFSPMSRGHCVFFPRRHAPSLHDLDDAELTEIMLLLKRAAAAMGLEHYNVLQNNGALAGQTAFMPTCI